MLVLEFIFVKQNTAYEMRIMDWSSDVCSSDLALGHRFGQRAGVADAGGAAVADHVEAELLQVVHQPGFLEVVGDHQRARPERGLDPRRGLQALGRRVAREQAGAEHHRSEEHTSELQSLMRISYAVFCLKKK